jgi:hypothetical protein
MRESRTEWKRDASERLSVSPAAYGALTEVLRQNEGKAVRVCIAGFG